MEKLFVTIFHFFRQRRRLFWQVFVAILVLIAIVASRIHIEEDISKFFPDDKRVEKLNYVFRNSRLAERIVVMVSTADSTDSPQADSLVAIAGSLVDSIQDRLNNSVASVQSQVDDSQILEVIQTLQEHLPIFLDESDYPQIEELIRPENIRSRLESNYRQLISPTGIATKKLIANDPLGISFIALKKLQSLQFDDNIETYQNYLVSKDHRHLFFFVQLKFSGSDTGHNGPVIDEVERIEENLNQAHPQFVCSAFGSAVVAVGNARQLQRDTILTVSLMLILLAVFILGFFRKKRVPFLIMLPVAFGAIFSIACIALIQGSISIIAIAAGSIVLGIAVNYSLHFLSHLKHTPNIEMVIRDLAKPMTLGSATTVLAFFCLQFVNAAVLRDLGLFAGFSLIGAALCSLIFLPQFISQAYVENQTVRHSWIERMSMIKFHNKKPLVISIILLTPVFLYFASDVSFNADLSQLNFMTYKTREAQSRLESINRTSLSSSYIVSQSGSWEEALKENERVTSMVKTLKSRGAVQKFSSLSSFIVSDSLQQVRIDRWKQFWTNEKVAALMTAVRTHGREFKFSDKVFQNFDTLIRKQYSPAGDDSFESFRRLFFADQIIQKDGVYTVITLATIAPHHREAVYNELSIADINVFDRQMMANLFVEYVHTDFNFIVTFTGILVFLALLVSYGRIELTLITFIPMLITWIWILGIMALVGIEFNIVNVMISTFIFGLGDDYSIFTMDGLMQEYQFKRTNLDSIRTSILLSALTTISGLGVLIFAEHPALRSIAAISIIGIACVFFMSQTLSPLIFRWLISSRAERGLAPMTAWGMLKTIFTYGFFVAGSFALTLIGLILKIIPFAKNRTRLFYHTLLSFFTRSLVKLSPQLHVNVLGRGDFRHSSIIISNHASFLDIIFTTMLHPKLILLTNKWVWNSPVFGGVVRLADYYPVMEGAQDSVDRVKDRFDEGYSVVVFPEGTRTPDGVITRFHKGAFYMAELLKAPIQPLLIHGAHDAIPKGTIYLNTAHVTLKFLPKIDPQDLSFGQTYSERTKSISRHFKSEFEKLKAEKETPAYFNYKLVKNYTYKGPVLEWYCRIKVALEDNYAPFHKLVPASGKVLDLGCGYGFLCYMLSFLSDKREITGVDYDEEKIATAQNCYSKSERVNFIADDITNFSLTGQDAIIIADVLHYLTPPVQESLISRSIEALKPNGKLIIREGNAELAGRHRGTKLTEFFSVKVLKFNKSVNSLHFLKAETVRRIADSHGCHVEILDDTKFTSNVIFVVEKR